MCNITDVGRKFQVHIAIESYNLEIDSCSETSRRSLMGQSRLSRGDCRLLSAVKVFIIIVIEHLRFSSHSRSFFFFIPLGACFSDSLYFAGALYITSEISIRLYVVAWKWTDFSRCEKSWNGITKVYPFHLGHSCTSVTRDSSIVWFEV